MKKFVLFVLILFLLFPIQVFATDTIDQVENEIFSEFDFTEIDTMMEEIFPGEKKGFYQMLCDLVEGDLDFSIRLIGELIWDQFTYEISNSKNGLIHILLLVIVAAIFSNFSSVFKSTQVAEIGFSVLYMFMLTICLNNFRVLLESVSVNLSKLIAFMEVLGPVYFLAVGMATGSVTSVAFYQLILILAFLVELMIINFLLPVVQVYLIIKVLGEFSPEVQLSKFAKFLNTIVSWTLKTLMASVVGLNVIQRLLMPAIDSVKRSVLVKGGEAIPLIGDVVGGSAEIVIGTAVVIKNGIGVLGMVICILICIPPMIQLGVTAILYQFISALIQPISDKRMVNCVSGMAEGSKLLLKISVTTGILFLLTIAVVATTTGG